MKSLFTVVLSIMLLASLFLVVQDEKFLFFEIPHEFEILFSGTFGDKISYIVEVEFEHENIPTQTLMMT